MLNFLFLINKISETEPFLPHKKILRMYEENLLYTTNQLFVVRHKPDRQEITVFTATSRTTKTKW